MNDDSEWLRGCPIGDNDADAVWWRCDNPNFELDWQLTYERVAPTLTVRDGDRVVYRHHWFPEPGLDCVRRTFNSQHKEVAVAVLTGTWTEVTE